MGCMWDDSRYSGVTHTAYTPAHWSCKLSCAEIFSRIPILTSNMKSFLKMSPTSHSTRGIGARGNTALKML